ncbi:MAG: phosphatidylserine decarboxylase [Rhodobacterales bacterium]|nr:phosphatidylserine decarboxylase [Rhodobacterales bacterium]
MDTKILFHNRYTNELEEEKVYGDRWLKFIYTNPLGKLCLWALVKRAIFSKWYGWRMNQNASSAKILPFIQEYSLDTTDFADEVSSFKNFNEFFFRKLTTSSRPIDRSSETIVFPADGRHLGFQNVDETKQVFVKGQKFNLEKLFGSKKLAQPFKGGSLILSRLCPVDYHRFHLPTAGRLHSVELINGHLFSVNPIALRQSLSIFWRNKRYLTLIENEHLGQVAVFLVGATCVGSVHFTAQKSQSYDKGDELGYFSFGGSSVITVFQPDKIKLEDELLHVSSRGHEYYAKMGAVMGRFL